MNMGKHRDFVKRKFLRDILTMNLTQMDHSRRSWFGKPEGTSLRKADLANTRAPVLRIDGTIRSLMHKVQAPPGRIF